MPVILSPEAIEDPRHIRAYISKENPTAASRVAVQIVVACDRLDFMPNRGRLGRQPGTRELAMRPYVIVYRVTLNAVEIVRIWHMAQSRN
jgi:plasmid stabilization system protein ParE